MNILPKKSWHVRNKDNVARVRRDEAAAEVERRKRDARALRAEQEVRTELLRKRARVGGRSPSPETPPVLFPPPEEAPNREHEAEKRREQERREKALGLLTFLGQSAAEAQSAPPWYLRPPPRGGEGRPGVGEGRPGVGEGRPEVGEGRKALLDPLQEMGEGRRKALGPRTEPRSTPGPSPRRGGGGLAELRQQRLAREASEAARSRELLGEPRKSPKFSQNHPKFTQNRSRERRRCYNSQFHPELGRDPRK